VQAGRKHYCNFEMEKALDLKVLIKIGAAPFIKACDKKCIKMGYFFKYIYIKLGTDIIFIHYTTLAL
jgi:hypothetical protein